jgi:L-arabinokinase
VVGAPCGVMDQMTSALGEAGSLLALRCQPAEMLSPVSLPPHIRLWGVDSGIRHRWGRDILPIRLPVSVFAACSGVS